MICSCRLSNPTKHPSCGRTWRIDQPPSCPFDQGSTREKKWSVWKIQTDIHCISGWWYIYPLWKIWKLVGMIIPNIWKIKNVPNHQPDIICIIYIYIHNWQIPNFSLTDPKTDRSNEIDGFDVNIDLGSLQFSQTECPLVIYLAMENLYL